MTLEEYIAAANRRLDPPLSGREIAWANNAREGGIKPERFAGWLALTASALLPMEAKE